MSRRNTSLSQSRSRRERVARILPFVGGGIRLAEYGSLQNESERGRESGSEGGKEEWIGRAKENDAPGPVLRSGPVHIQKDAMRKVQRGGPKKTVGSGALAWGGGSKAVLLDSAYPSRMLWTTAAADSPEAQGGARVQSTLPRQTPNRLRRPARP